MSITVSNTPNGTLIVSNNLWQSAFTLSGPSGRTGNGRSLIITNATAGQYTIQHGAVPYFVTPANQTNTLTAGGTITFTGNYTFADANHNGIPDAYETEKFGTIDPLRTQFTDTDGDGLGDWAEFVAGTDPTNALSSFRLSATMFPSQQIRLAWPSAPDHGYRLLGSANAANWSPASGWMRATNYSANLTLPSASNSTPTFFRVEAQP